MLESRTFAPPEIRNPSERPTRFLPPITAEKLFGKKDDPSLSLGLGSAPLHIAKIEKDHKTEYLTVVDNVIAREGLRAFLRGISPVPRFTGGTKAGVIADWKMPDDSDEESLRLKRLHESLGKAMGIFEKHRKIFLYELINSKESDTLIYLQLLTRKQAEKHSIDTRNAEIVISLLPEDLRKQFLDLIRGSVGRRNKHAGRIRKSERSAFNFFSNLQPSKRNEVFFSFLDSIGEEVKEKVIDPYVDKNFAKIVLPSFPGFHRTQYAYIDRACGTQGASIEFLSRKRVRVTDANHSLCYEANVGCKDGALTFDVLPQTLRSKGGLLPIIRWKKEKSSDRREFSFEFLPEDEDKAVSSVVDDKWSDLGYHINPLIGFLTVAYFSPEIREHWPKEVGLPGTDRKQQMGPAQVPVLALIYERSLVQSDFLQKIEDYAA